MKMQNVGAGILMALILSSCGSESVLPQSDTKQESVPTAAITEEAESDEYSVQKPELPSKNYGGADFTFLANPRTAATFKEIYLVTDALDGEIINDTIFNRNTRIEAEFNIKIKMLEKENTASVAKKMIQAGDTSFDVIDAQAVNLATLATGGYLYDFHMVPYIQPEAPYWSKTVAEDLTIGGHLYIMPCDLSMRFFGAARFIFFNKKLISTYELESPYLQVEENRWTLEAMMNDIAAVNADLDGDGDATDKDLYGLLSEGGESAVDFVIGHGIRFVKKTDDGELETADFVEAVQDVLDMVSPFMNNKQYVRNFEDLKNKTELNQWDFGRTLFNNGQFLFTQGGTGVMEQFRNMKDDFGVVPNPKFDEQQEEYSQRASVWDLMFAIPQTVQDTEKVGLVMEYGAWLSHETLLPAYYETTIKQKIVRDEKDIIMLNIIKDTTHVDLADLYQIGLNEVIFTAYKSGNFTSTYEKRESAIQNKLTKISENLKAVENSQ